MKTGSDKSVSAFAPLAPSPEVTILRTLSTRRAPSPEVTILHTHSTRRAPSPEVTILHTHSTRRVPSPEVTILHTHNTRRVPSPEVTILHTHSTRRVPSPEVTILHTHSTRRVPSPEVTILHTHSTRRVPSPEVTILHTLIIPLALGGVAGQRHAPSPLPWEWDLVPIVQELWWAPGLVWRCAEKPPLPEFDPRVAQPVAKHDKFYDGSVKLTFLRMLHRTFL